MLNAMGRRAAMMILILLAVHAPTGLRAAEAVLATFTLQEYLGRPWPGELVFFALDDAALAGVASATLFDPDSRPVPFQVGTDRHGRPAVAVKLDLPPFERLTYRLVAGTGRRPPNSPLRVEREPERIRVLSGAIGLEIPTSKGPYRDGPFLRLRMQSGTWIGSSRLVTTCAITNHQVRVEEGPVFVDVETTYAFEGGKTWRIRYRVIAGEPVVDVDETFDLADGSRWELSLEPGFSPTHAVTQTKSGHGYRRLDYTRRSSPFQLAGWVPWWQPSVLAHVGLFSVDPRASLTQRDSAAPTAVLPPPAPKGGTAAEPLGTKALPSGEGIESELLGTQAKGERLVSVDLFAVASGKGSRWATEGENGQGKTLPIITDIGGKVSLAAPLAGPGRKWAIAAFLTDDCLVPAESISPPQTLMIKYCDIPLDEVKDMVLDWDPAGGIAYPNLIATRDRFAARPEIVKLLASNRELPDPDAVSVNARRVLEPAVRVFTGAADQMASNVQTIHRCERIMAYTLYADLMLGSDVLTPRELEKVKYTHAIYADQKWIEDKVLSAADRRFVRAQAAFLCYKLANPDYYSVSRNYRANPNMTTARHTALALLACLIPEHPMARPWASHGMAEVDRELKEWIGPNGGWLESPHYQTVSLGVIMLLAYAAHNAGIADYLHDPQLLKTVVYLAKLSTPPDPRFGGKRHFPPVGNTYQMETSMLFGVFAELYRARNPELADALQWIWIEQGRPEHFGNGGGVAFDPSFYKSGIVDPDIEPKGPPNWGSELFPAFGAVLRSGFPGPRETYMCFKSGWTYEHYDIDNGSFELWGKGRPLCLEWGYQSRMPAWQHNRVGGGNAGRIRTFGPLASADYVSSDNGSWDRQILLVKDEDPLGPNYFVLSDTVRASPADWWLWNYTDHNLTLHNGVVRSTGRDDVDLDIWFGPTAAKAIEIKDAALAMKEDAAQTQSTAGPSIGDSKLGDAIAGLGTSGPDDADVALFEREVAATSGKAPTRSYVTTKVFSLSCFDARTQTQEPMTQRGLTLKVTPKSPVFSVLFPRLRTEPDARFTSLAEGRGVKIETQNGIDYAFLAGEPFDYAEGEIVFSGAAGAIQVRPGHVILSLNSGTSIAYGPHRLVSDTPDSRRFVVK